MSQSYGDEEDWREHFYYLLRAFKDRRYTWRDGKPVILIYRAADVERCDEMLAYWDELARDNGLGGIYAVQMLTYVGGSNWRNFDARLEF